MDEIRSAFVCKSADKKKKRKRICINRNKMKKKRLPLTHETFFLLLFCDNFLRAKCNKSEALHRILIVRRYTRYADIRFLKA